MLGRATWGALWFVLAVRLCKPSFPRNTETSASAPKQRVIRGSYRTTTFSFLCSLCFQISSLNFNSNSWRFHISDNSFFLSISVSINSFGTLILYGSIRSKVIILFHRSSYVTHNLLRMDAYIDNGYLIEFLLVPNVSKLPSNLLFLCWIRCATLYS